MSRTVQEGYISCGIFYCQTALTRGVSFVVPLFLLCCCLPTPMTLASEGSPMFPLVVHQPASLASSVVTPAGSVHKSRGDNVVCMWMQLKR